MKTGTIILENVKDPDGQIELANELSLEDEVGDIFEYGEFANLEITIDEKLNIISGRVIRFKK